MVTQNSRSGLRRKTDSAQRMEATSCQLSAHTRWGSSSTAPDIAGDA